MAIGNIGNGILNGINGNAIGDTRNSIKEGFSKSNADADSFVRRLESAMENRENHELKDDKDLKKVCQEFESIFLSMMYKQMKATVPKSDLLPNDSGREIFESMLDDQLVEGASKASSSQRFGLADVLYKQLSQQLRSISKPDSGEEGSKVVEND